MRLSTIADRTVARIYDEHPTEDHVIEVIDLVSGGELDFTQVGIVLDMVQSRLEAKGRRLECK